MKCVQTNLQQKSSLLAQPLALAALALSLLGASGCKKAFVTGTIDDALDAPGTFTIPAKVDVIFFEDDSDSMKQAFTEIQEQLPYFVADLAHQGWDYRFATVPLTRNSMDWKQVSGSYPARYASYLKSTSELRKIEQIVPSIYDTNWGADWKAPFPGADFYQQQAYSVDANYFRTFWNYTDFIEWADINNGLGSHEPGFQTIKETLALTHNKNKFFRNDALRMVIVLSNGEDDSGVTYCTRSDGWVGPCEQVPGQSQYGTAESSFQSYKTTVANSAPGKVRFYSAVSFKQGWYCLGGYSRIGTRYKKMAQELGGQSYDICTQSIASIFTDMAQHVQEQKDAFRLKYIVLGTEPEVSTIKVYRLINGDPNQAQEIPYGYVNGWTYSDYQTVYQIDYPANLSLATGYTIELHGTAKIVGDDKPKVDYKPKGFQNSSN